jgi:glycerol uptake facilitator protein
MSGSTLAREMGAEFLGTLILLLFGNGVVAQTVLFPDKGNFTNINIAWGLGVVFGIYVAARVSGAHLNPAVSVTMAAFGGFPWRKVLPYSVAQTAGAFAGAGIVFLTYRAAFAKVDPLLERTAGVFATFPSLPESFTTGLVDQILGTAILLLLVCALADARNQPLAGFTPLLVGLVVVGIGMAFGSLHGYAINPARDFGPRLFTVLAGFRNNGLSDGTGVFWVPVVGPLVGGLLGGFLYHRLLR